MNLFKKLKRTKGKPIKMVLIAELTDKQLKDISDATEFVASCAAEDYVHACHSLFNVTIAEATNEEITAVMNKVEKIVDRFFKKLEKPKTERATAQE